MLPFSKEDEGSDIAREIADRAIGIAVKEKNIANLERIADDQEELLAFIDSITEEEIDKKSKRIGDRNMVDMADLVRKVYYSPHAGGRNSIKRIFPAIIHDCPTVAEQFSQEGKYGSGLEFSSRNFDDHVWIRDEKNRDPYKTLLPLTNFDGIADYELFDDLGEVSDGRSIERP